MQEEALEASASWELFKRLNSSYPQPPSVELDVGLYPNPFQGVKPSTFLDTNETFLKLIDGGQNGEAIPFQPLLVKARGIDTIIALDGSRHGDDNFFAQGNGLVVNLVAVSI